MSKRVAIMPAATTSVSDPPVQRLIADLPDEMSRLIIGYIPKEEHDVVALVSKKWNSALSPLEWSSTRSELCLEKESLYIRFKVNSTYLWRIFNQSQNPQLRLNPDNFSCSSFPNDPINLQTSGSTFAVLGTKIYAFGGTSNDIPINNVWTYDCSTDALECGPEMLLGRESAVAEVVNKVIYVMGGRLSEELDENLNQVVDGITHVMGWMEKFDYDIGVWQKVSTPINISKMRVSTSCAVDGRIYARTVNNWIVFNPTTEEWSVIESKKSKLRWRGRPAVLAGVIYFQRFTGDIIGYDVGKNVWKELKVMFPKFLDGVTVGTLDGNLCVLWEKQHKTEKGVKVDIKCVEIEVSEAGDGELNGLVLRERVIMQLPSKSSAVHCLSVYL
ncbi:F-box/kelch-repeat protein SKIP6-like [Apium graveolens]|uniref:F-box/kelch-repeat protein SKIP6-like n=1 Tax=Apium graveolens TaxID=4045 RepID=UPI003D7BC600